MSHLLRTVGRDLLNSIHWLENRSSSAGIVIGKHCRLSTI